MHIACGSFIVKCVAPTIVIDGRRAKRMGHTQGGKGGRTSSKNHVKKILFHS